MSRLGVGIVGCGWAGEQHARAYSLLSGVELRAVADVDEGKAKEFGTRWGVKNWYSDYRWVLEDSSVDAVSICLPHYLHSIVTVESAEAGKHVLCEKPMANNLDEADTMIRATKTFGVTLMIAENVRFHPTNIKIKELLDKNYIGEVFLARIFRDHELHDSLRKRPWFLNKEKAGGGIWMSGGFHDVDALRMLIGEVETVSLSKARSVFPDMEGEDTVVAVLKFKNDAIGVITESFSTKTYEPISPIGCPSILNGSLGTISTTLNGLEIFGERVGNISTCMRIRIEDRDTFVEEIREFITCIKTQGKPITSGEEERRTLAVVCAGYESLDRGEVPVRVRC